MGKVNIMMLAFNSVFLLGLICSTVMGVAGYVAADKWPILAASPAVTVPVSAAEPGQASRPAPENEADLTTKQSRIEYYRGVFDICVFSGSGAGSPEEVFMVCREVVRSAVEQNWFEIPSREWRWPLPAGPAEANQNG